MAGRVKTGAFSSNIRVATFLSELSALSVELLHKPGKEMFSSDYISRHPVRCTHDKCQVCSYASDLQKIGDNANQIRSVSVDDVLKGFISMPFIQRNICLDIQNNDELHTKLKYFISIGLPPEKKKTKGDMMKLKLMHNIYKKGDLKICYDGLVMVKGHSPNRQD